MVAVYLYVDYKFPFKNKTTKIGPINQLTYLLRAKAQ